MAKKKSNNDLIPDENLMDQLKGDGDDERLLPTQKPKVTAHSKLTTSDQPIPAGVREAVEEPRKSVEAAQEPVRTQIHWEQLINSRSKLLNQIEEKTTAWPATKLALQNKLKVDENAIKQQIKNLEAEWYENKVKIAEGAEKKQDEITRNMKTEADAWLQQEQQLKQEVTDFKEKIHKHIAEKTKIWLKQKDKLNQEVKQHEADQQLYENEIISFKQEETQLKLQLAGRIVNNMYILIKDDKNLSPTMQEFVNDVAKIKESNQNKVIFTDDDQLQKFKNKMPVFSVDRNSKSTLTFNLSNALNELTKYDVNQYGSNMQEVNDALKAFTQYANKEQIYKSVPQFSEIDTIEQNRQKVTNNTNKITGLNNKIGAIEADLKTQEQAHQKQITTLHQSIAEAEEKIVKAKQAYETNKADLNQTMEVNLARFAEAEREYQTKKAALEAEITTVQSQGKKNIQQEETAYQERINKLEKEYEQVNTEFQMVRQNIQNEQEQQALEEKRIKSGQIEAENKSEGKAKKSVAKSVGRSLKNFAKNAKEKAQELGTTIKTTIGEAKDKVSEKLEPVKKGVSDLKDAFIKDDIGSRRNWKEIIKTKKNNLINKIRGPGRE